MRSILINQNSFKEKKGKLFEWVDGPLIEAMQKGSVFLADEISLADDSVLERLNSLLGKLFCYWFCLLAIYNAK